MARYFARNLFAGVCSASVLTLTSAAAYGQVTGDPETGVESNSTGQIQEIVVTAERRVSTTQKTAATLEVLDPDAIRKAGLSTPADLTKLTTGLNLSFGGSNTQIFIRGVGDFSYSPQDNPGIAFNVDGIYVGRPNGVAGNFYDVARVEVLKGPQGTLYGRNANGGAINLITNAPELGRRYANVTLEAGNYSLFRTTGAVNLPVTDNSALRVAYNIVQRDGYLSDGSDDDKQQAVRVRFKVEPSDAFSLILNADYSHIGGRGAGFVFLPKRPGASPWEAVTDPRANAYRASIPPIGFLVDDAQPISSVDNEFYNFSAEMNVDLGFATWTVIPAYRHVKVDATTIPSFRIDEQTDGDQYSLETRLAGKTSVVEWVIGGFAYREKLDNLDNVKESDILQNVTVTLHPRTTSYAAFGQATIGFTPELRLIGGLRYTYENRKLDGLYINQSPLTGGPNQILEVFGGRVNFDGVTYKVGLEYDIAPRSMLYATYSTGFKSGGLGQTVAPLNVYQPEKLKALEVGAKNRFFNNRLQFNASGFYWKYMDIHDSRTAFDPLGVINFLVFNAGDAEIYGGTADITYAPTDNDRLSFSAEYAKSKYNRFNFSVPDFVFNPASTGCPVSPGTDAVGRPVIQGDCAGIQVARVPKWTGSASYEHDFTLPGDGVLTAGGRMKFSGARWLGTNFIPAERAKGFAVFDATLTYRPAGAGFTVTAFARNLTNKAYYLGGQQQPFVGGLLQANIAPPRTYGLTLTATIGDR